MSEGLRPKKNQHKVSESTTTGAWLYRARSIREIRGGILQTLYHRLSHPTPIPETPTIKKKTRPRNIICFGLENP